MSGWIAPREESRAIRPLVRLAAMVKDTGETPGSVGSGTVAIPAAALKGAAGLSSVHPELVTALLSMRESNGTTLSAWLIHSI